MVRLPVSIRAKAKGRGCWGLGNLALNFGIIRVFQGLVEGFGTGERQGVSVQREAVGHARKGAVAGAAVFECGGAFVGYERDGGGSGSHGLLSCA